MSSAKVKRISKNRLGWLGMLMTASVLGIVVAQYLWINQSVRVQQQQLERSAYMAINRAVARLEREQSAALMLHPFLGGTPFLQQGIMAPPAALGEGKGRIEAQLSVNGKSINKVFEFDPSGTASDRLMQLALDSMQHTMNQWADDAQSEGGDLQELLMQMAREFETRHTPMVQAFDPAQLDQILKTEFRNVGVTIPFAYSVVDHSTRQEYVSKGYESREGATWSEFRVQMFPGNIFRMWADYELRVQLPFTTLYVLRTQASLLGLSALFTLFILGTFWVTMRTLINQKKISEIKSDFINNMTHEFKTPIATISLASDSIAAPSVLERPEVIKSFLSIIKEENSRMNSQVERILQMSLIDKKDFTVMPAIMEINGLVRKAIQNMGLFIQESGGEVVTRLMDAQVQLNLDEVHFTNVVVNLVENAIKYSTGKPFVEIWTAVDKGGVKLGVKDRGIGMTREQQQKIFEKFYRATSGNIHNVKGFGLGLSYVKAVVDAHGGTIAVSSRPGEGSEFVIWIPAAPEHRTANK